jgi:hypothetical protein
MLGLQPRAFDPGDQASAEKKFFNACADRCQSLGWKVENAQKKSPFKMVRGDAAFHVVPVLPFRTSMSTFITDLFSVIARVKYEPTILVTSEEIDSRLRERLHEARVYVLNYSNLLHLSDEIYTQDRSFPNSKIINCFGGFMRDVPGRRIQGWLRFVDMVDQRQPESVVLLGERGDLLSSTPWPRPDGARNNFIFAYPINGLNAVHPDDETIRLEVIDSEGKRHNAGEGGSLRQVLNAIREEEGRSAPSRVAARPAAHDA